MRILLPSIRSTSGIDTYTANLAMGLAGAGHEAVVVDQIGNYEPPHPLVARVELRQPRSVPAPVQPFAEWGLQRQVQRIAAEHHVDGIHATRLGMAPRHLPLVITAWDPAPGPVERFRLARGRGEEPATEAAFAIADAVAARRAAAIVAVTPAVRRGYERFGRCETIPPFLPDTEVRTPVPEPSEDVVMVAGLLDLERKGLDLALAAMDRLRQVRSEARLVLVGDWEDPARARSLPSYCEATGRLSSDELKVILAGSGCCLIPSLWEEFGYAGLEALAAGTPVACSPLPAYEGLAGGGVFAARSREPQALAGELEAALATSSFEFPPECRASVAVPRLVELYEEAFGASRRAAG